MRFNIIVGSTVIVLQKPVGAMLLRKELACALR
jgi:hypothetical protein